MLAKYQENSQRRVLTKVRRNFAVKKDEDEDQVVDTSARFISDSNMYILSGTIGLVEVNRKIFIGPQYLNQHFSISKSFVQDKLSSRAVLLSLCSNPNRSAISCEYTMKRLESYGDLELATWAHRMTKFQRSYPKLMDDYLSTRKLDNAEQVMDIKDKLHKMREEIESRYAYYKVVKHYNRETNYLSEISYSEDFISAMGHSVESFLGWTEKNGLPAVFDHECPVYLSTIKKVLDGSVLSSNYVSQGQEYKTSIIDKKGLKKAVQVQSICLLEPTEDGYIMNGYFVLKKSDPKKEFLAEPEDFKPNLWKQKKMDNSFEKDMEVEGTKTSSGEC